MLADVAPEAAGMGYEEVTEWYAARRRQKELEASAFPGTAAVTRVARAWLASVFGGTS